MIGDAYDRAHGLDSGVERARKSLSSGKPIAHPIRPKLTRSDIQLCYEGLGVWASDYNRAPHDEIEKLREKLIKLGAKKP